MGLFDYVECRYPLPEAPSEIQNAEFQTKSFDCPYLEHYIIEADGRLLYYGTEPTPKNELPYPNAEPGSLESIRGILRKVKEPEILSTFIGAVDFYASSTVGELFEYVALFDEGRLLKVKRVPNQESVPPTKEERGLRDSKAP